MVGNLTGQERLVAFESKKQPAASAGENQREDVQGLQQNRALRSSCRVVEGATFGASLGLKPQRPMDMAWDDEKFYAATDWYVLNLLIHHRAVRAVLTTFCYRQTLGVALHLKTFDSEPDMNLFRRDEVEKRAAAEWLSKSGKQTVRYSCQLA